MFHHRWWAPVDQDAASLVLARLSIPFAAKDEVDARAAMVKQRMTGRGGFVGSSAATAPLISAYWFELLDILEPHLAARKYLFGGRPAFADFGLAPQLYECSVDPTCGAAMRGRAPAVLDWCHRMLEPRADGPFETWASLAPTLTPLLAYVGRYFLPWSKANAAALAAGEPEFSVDLPGGAYVQAPQKYHAKSLGGAEGEVRGGGGQCGGLVGVLARRRLRSQSLWPAGALGRRRAPPPSRCRAPPPPLSFASHGRSEVAAHRSTPVQRSGTGGGGQADGGRLAASTQAGGADHGAVERLDGSFSEVARSQGRRKGRAAPRSRRRHDRPTSPTSKISTKRSMAGIRQN